MSSFRPTYDPADGIPALEVVAGLPRKGLITLDEIRGCLASIARKPLAIEERLAIRVAPPATPAPQAPSPAAAPPPAAIPPPVRGALAAKVVSVLRHDVELRLDQVVEAVGLAYSATSLNRVREVLNDCIQSGSVARREVVRPVGPGKRPFLYRLAQSGAS